jgi:hypothetical protein
MPDDWDIGVAIMNAQEPEITRVEWNEIRRNEGAYLVIADWNGLEWEFWERDSWEVRWYPMAPNADLIAKAEEIYRARGGHRRQRRMMAA